MATMVWELYEALREAEVSDVKAKAAAKAVVGEEDKSGLSTKEDIHALKIEILTLKTDMMAMEVRITRTILTAMISITAIFAAIVKLF
ncbi:MAG: hypothetical protein H7839_19260 [Magnetococcus sp. YQC-5]